MGQEIYIAESEREVELRECEDYHIHEELHDIIFLQNKQFLRSDSILWRLGDQYNDAFFMPGEMTRLKADLKDFMSKSPDKDVRNFASRMINICEKAERLKKGIIGFGD